MINHREILRLAFSTVKGSLFGIQMFHTDRGSEFDNALVDELVDSFQISRPLSMKAPSLLLAGDALTLVHRVVPVDHDGVGVVNDVVTDGVGQGAFADLSVPAGGSNRGQKIVDALLQRASTISSRSRSSIFFNGNRSHSSMISSLTCLYCFTTLCTSRRRGQWPTRSGYPANGRTGR